MKIEARIEKFIRHAELATATGWTAISYSPFLKDKKFGVPPEGSVDRRAVEMSGLKCEVPPAHELIDNMPAGPELDALVAKILGYDVLGITNCVSDYVGGYDILYDCKPVCPILRPVYLRGCCCGEFRKDKDIDYFGHFAACLEVAPEFSKDDKSAFEIVDWLVEQGYSVMVETCSSTTCYCQIRKLKNIEHLETFEKYIGWGKGETRAIAICRALVLMSIQKNLKS